MSLRKTIVLLILHLLALGQPAFSATLSWNANSETNISGYRVHYRTAFDDASTVIDVGRNTSFEFKGLQPETKYFVHLTAYSVHGLESRPSSGLSFYTPPSTPKLRVLPEGIQLAIQGKPGGTLELYQSSDLKNWTWSQTILNTTGEIDLDIDQTAAGGRQFFRLENRGDTLAGWLALQGLSDPNSLYQNYSINNQFAYSTGADLAGGPTKTQPTLGVIEQPWESGTERFATFNYTIREGTIDVHPVIEMSHDLKLWIRAEPSLATHSSVLNGNGTRTITLRETIPSSENPHGRRFYRLRFDTPPEMRLEDWLALHDTLAPNGDVDENGINNAFTFASGADLLPNPHNSMPSIGSTLWTTGSTSPQTYTTFRYRLRDNITGVTPVVEFSNNLQNWQPAEEVTVLHTDISNNDGTRSITIRETEARGHHAKRFYRVRYVFETPDTLAGWLALKGVSDPHAAYQGHSASNQFAYSTGADLAGGPAKVQPTLGMIEQPWESGTERFATFNYTIREGTIDVHPVIEMSHDLKLWIRAEPSLTTHSSVLNGNGTRTITLRETIPSSENPHGRRFYRLRFDTPPEMRLEDWLTLNDVLDSNGDIDGNGINNAFTFASGADLLLNPRDAMPSIRSTLWTAGDMPIQTYTTFRYRVRDHVTGVTPVVEFSNDLQIWQTAEDLTVPHSDISNGDGTRSITIRETEARGRQSKGFYRLRYVFDSP